ncbi:MAG: hypothetical protein LBJ21_07180 [Acidobacteriota bacterium]|jgi:hypothetical protein|nr:hypothetical protein [Acidobacteriota bacterium]
MDAFAIRDILAQYRALQGEHALLRSLAVRDGDEDVPPGLRKKIAVIEAWLRLLTDEEWFVVTKHLVDQLTWAMVLGEYERRWGPEQIRDERTLKRTQARALQKIAACVGQNNLGARIHALFS